MGARGGGGARAFDGGGTAGMPRLGVGAGLGAGVVTVVWRGVARLVVRALGCVRGCRDARWVLRRLGARVVGGVMGRGVVGCCGGRSPAVQSRKTCSSRPKIRAR